MHGFFFRNQTNQAWRSKGVFSAQTFHCSCLMSIGEMLIFLRYWFMPSTCLWWRTEKNRCLSIQHRPHNFQLTSYACQTWFHRKNSNFSCSANTRFLTFLYQTHNWKTPAQASLWRRYNWPSQRDWEILQSHYYI